MGLTPFEYIELIMLSSNRPFCDSRFLGLDAVIWCSVINATVASN